MELDPDLDPGVRRGLPARDQGLADLLQRFFHTHSPGQVVGPDLDPPATQVRHQVHEGLARLDVLFDDGRVGGMELANRAAAPDFKAHVGTALADVFALVLAQRGLDAVLVRGAKLDRAQADFLAHLADRVEIPGRGNVVGDDP